MATGRTGCSTRRSIRRWTSFPEHRRFQAGWSMRDVEPGVRIKPRGPDGERVGGAGDMA